MSLCFKIDVIGDYITQAEESFNYYLLCAKKTKPKTAELASMKSLDETNKTDLEIMIHVKVI